MKKALSLLLVLSMSIMMITPASAYTTELELEYVEDVDRVNFSNAYSTNAEPGMIVNIGVSLYVYNYETHRLICDVDESLDSPGKNWVASSWSVRSLPSGRYMDEGAGWVNYYGPLSWQDTVEAKEAMFFHNVNSDSRNGVPDAQAQIKHKREFAEQGTEMMRSFGGEPEGYHRYVGIDVLTALESIEEYLYIKSQMYLTFGDTVPVYFVSPDRRTILAVKLDAMDDHYLFTFKRDGNGGWDISRERRGNLALLQGNIARGAEILKALGVYDHVPEGYSVYVNSELVSQFRDVRDYLSVRRQLDLFYGDSVPIYCLSPDQSCLVAIFQRADGLTERVTFQSDKKGGWQISARENV